MSNFTLGRFDTFSSNITPSYLTSFNSSQSTTLQSSSFSSPPPNYSISSTPSYFNSSTTNSFNSPIPISNYSIPNYNNNQPVNKISIYNLANGTYGPSQPGFFDHIVGDHSLDAEWNLNPHTIVVKDDYIQIFRENGHNSVYNRETGTWDTFTL